VMILRLMLCIYTCERLVSLQQGLSFLSNCTLRAADAVCG